MANDKCESIRPQLMEDMADDGKTSEYLRIISQELRCTPEQALNGVLKAKVHDLTCQTCRQTRQPVQQYEPSRH